MTWAPFLVSNFPRIASVRAAFDRRRLLTVNPSCALFCVLLRSLGTGAHPERLGQATIKIFALDQKLPVPMSHGGNPEPRMSALGQERTLKRLHSMSALLPKADIGFAHWGLKPERFGCLEVEVFEDIALGGTFAPAHCRGPWRRASVDLPGYGGDR
jgi:hypothetical protein